MNFRAVVLLRREVDQAAPGLGQRVEVVGRGPWQVDSLSYSDETVWIDRACTVGFSGISEDAWYFRFGGYQVCEKWLKDRGPRGGRNPVPGRLLGDDEIRHYRELASAVDETLLAMSALDEAVAVLGGWDDTVA